MAKNATNKWLTKKVVKHRFIHKIRLYEKSFGFVLEDTF